MKCRAAQRLIHAERDHGLSAGDRVALDAHLTACATCRDERKALAAAAQAWKVADAAAARLDVERAWHDIRREIRGARQGSRLFTGRFSRLFWSAVPVAAAAAVGVTLWIQNPGQEKLTTRKPMMAWAEYVEVDDGSATPVVFVDEESGWVVVWAAAAEGGKS